MNKLVLVFVSVLIGLPLFLGYAADAEAKRLGGGSSFGSRSSYNSPYKRSAAEPSRSASQDASAQRNQAARDAFSRRGGLMGMLGGLALGGLLGAMLFGGAFENINLFDMAVLALVAFVLYRLFMAKKMAAAGTASASGAPYKEEPEDYRLYQRESTVSSDRGFDTDLMKDKKTGAATAGSGGDAGDADFEPASGHELAASAPKDFDSAAFLEGAKSAYRMLQQAWDRGEMADLRGLTTDRVFAEIQDQLRAREGDNVTEIIKLEAELLEIRERDGKHEATVLFDCVIRESADDRAGQVREIWHFIRPLNSSQPTWFLDGIQQLED